jgi:hypothetical protein
MFDIVIDIGKARTLDSGLSDNIYLAIYIWSSKRDNNNHVVYTRFGNLSTSYTPLLVSLNERNRGFN